MGNDVCCIDVDPAIIDRLRSCQVHIYEPGLEPLVKRNFEQGRLRFSANLADGIEDALFILNCVGTPSKPDGSCDLSYVHLVASQIGQVINEYKIIINRLFLLERQIGYVKLFRKK